MEMKKALTQDQSRRLVIAREETEKALNKELSYIPAHQKQDRIEFYKNHLKELAAMEEAGAW
jgi:hypothetical protein